VASRKGRRRTSRSRIVLRWLALGGVGLVAFLYVRPLTTYLHTRARLEQRSVEVRSLRAEKRQLERRMTASTSTASLFLAARRQGYVKPGEHLFIVRGIAAWRRAQRLARDAH
jgi:cell division protein FtsB